MFKTPHHPRTWFGIPCHIQPDGTLRPDVTQVERAATPGRLHDRINSRQSGRADCWLVVWHYNHSDELNFADACARDSLPCLLPFATVWKAFADAAHTFYLDRDADAGQDENFTINLSEKAHVPS